MKDKSKGKDATKASLGKLGDEMDRAATAPDYDWDAWAVAMAARSAPEIQAKVKGKLGYPAPADDPFEGLPEFPEGYPVFDLSRHTVTQEGIEEDSDAPPPDLTPKS